MKADNVFVYAACFGAILFGLLLAYVQQQTNQAVNPEFIIGILSTDGILFGFFSTVIGISFRDNKQFLANKHNLELAFFGSLVLLIISVFFVTANAFGWLSSLFALLPCFFSFYITSLSLSYIVYKLVFC